MDNMIPVCYSYNPVTFEFVAEVLMDEGPGERDQRLTRNHAREVARKKIAEDDADRDAKLKEIGEDEKPEIFHAPAFSTEVPPPAFTNGQRPVWSPQENLWRITHDYRDVRLFDTSNGEEIGSPALGQPLPDFENSGVTFHVPPAVEEGYVAVFENGAWAVHPDCFGKRLWNKVTQESHRAMTHGKVPDEFTEKEPPLASKWDELHGDWVTDPKAAREIEVLEAQGKLLELDMKKTRCITDILLGKGNQLGDDGKTSLERLQAYENESMALRDKIKG